MANSTHDVVNFPGSGVSFGALPPKHTESLFDPIKRMVIEGCYHLAVSKSIKVSWAMVPEFVEPGPYKFELYRGRAINDDAWEKTAEIVDRPWLYDNRPLLRPHERSLYYKLRITDGNGAVYWSHPVSFDVIWNHNDWRLVREIVRKELLIQGVRNGQARARGAGTKGWLIKARQFGDPCPRCLDKNSATATDSNCPICLGTGVTKGFYDPLEYWVIQQPGLRAVKIAETGETRTVVIESVRCLAHPAPESGDIWASTVGDTRYQIQGDIEKLARHRGVDVILGLRLLELPTTHVAYKIPLPNQSTYDPQAYNS